MQQLHTQTQKTSKFRQFEPCWLDVRYFESEWSKRAVVISNGLEASKANITKRELASSEPWLCLVPTWIVFPVRADCSRRTVLDLRTWSTVGHWENERLLEPALVSQQTVRQTALCLAVFLSRWEPPSGEGVRACHWQLRPKLGNLVCQKYRIHPCIRRTFLTRN